jgi:hypothetical protein
MHVQRCTNEAQGCLQAGQSYMATVHTHFGAGGLETVPPGIAYTLVPKRTIATCNDTRVVLVVVVVEFLSA